MIRELTCTCLSAWRVCALRLSPAPWPPTTALLQERKLQKSLLLQGNELLSDSYRELVKAGDLKDGRFWEPLLGHGKSVDAPAAQEVTPHALAFICVFLGPASFAPVSRNSAGGVDALPLPATVFSLSLPVT